MLYEYNDEGTDLEIKIRSMKLVDKDRDHLVIEVTFDTHEATLYIRPFHLWFDEKLIAISKIHLTDHEGKEIPKVVFQEVASGIQEVLGRQWEELREEEDSEMIYWQYTEFK